MPKQESTQRNRLKGKERTELTLWMHTNRGQLKKVTQAQAIAEAERYFGREMSPSTIRNIARDMDLKFVVRRKVEPDTVKLAAALMDVAAVMSDAHTSSRLRDALATLIVVCEEITGLEPKAVIASNGKAKPK